ncbi:hypothetical protein DXG01_015256 [Tephrocybe rancida]|nr:hypothetical protein DXG01_015256 [Tephrocybe rancida]
MRFWLSEEWRIINMALGTDDASLVYHLKLHRSSLLRLCSQWQLSVNLLNFGELASLPNWGPSAKYVINFRIAQKTAVFKQVPTMHTESNIELECQERDKESEYSDSEHGEADMILFDILNAADASHSGAEDDEYLYDD